MDAAEMREIIRSEVRTVAAEVARQPSTDPATIRMTLVMMMLQSGKSDEVEIMRRVKKIADFIASGAIPAPVAVEDARPVFLPYGG